MLKEEQRARKRAARGAARTLGRENKMVLGGKGPIRVEMTTNPNIDVFLAGFQKEVLRGAMTEFLADAKRRAQSKVTRKSGKLRRAIRRRVFSARGAAGRRWLRRAGLPQIEKGVVGVLHAPGRVQRYSRKEAKRTGFIRDAGRVSVLEKAVARRMDVWLRLTLGKWRP